MARSRLVPLLVIGATTTVACGIDVVGRLGPSDGGTPSPDGSLVSDGGSGDSNPSMPFDAGSDATSDSGSDAAVVVPAACSIGQLSCGASCVTATLPVRAT